MSFRILGEGDLLRAREEDREMLRDVADGRVNPSHVLEILDSDRRFLLLLASKAIRTQSWRWLAFGLMVGLLVGFGAGVILMIWVRW